MMFNEEEYEELKARQNRHYTLFGSHRRYNERIEKFITSGKRWPKARHKAQWLLHNVIVHPLVGLFPGKFTIELHDASSRGLNGGIGRKSPIPTIKNKKAWLRHNIVAHILIGLDPSEHSFRYHDYTARDMDIEGWV